MDNYDERKKSESLPSYNDHETTQRETNQTTSDIYGGEQSEVSFHSMLDDDNDEENENDEAAIENKDVERQDNEDEYKQQRKVYEIILIFMCCLFLFSTSYAKATPKNMQTSLPNAHQKTPIYPSMDYKTLSSKFVSWIAWIEAPIIIIAPFAGYLVNRYDAKIALMTSMIISYVGSAFCSLSVYYHIASWFPLGRFISGLGFGCLRIAVNVVIKESVAPEQLALYMQYPRTSEKSASLIDGYFTSSSFLTKRFNKDSKWVTLPFIVGTGLIMISLPFFVLFFYEPKNKNEILDRQEREKKKIEFERQQGVEMVRIEHDDDKKEHEIERKETNNDNDKDDDKVILNPFVFVWSKMKTFPKSYWLIILILFFNDAASGVYQGVLPQFLNIYYIPSEPVSFWQKSANVRQIPAYFAILSPIFGFIVDWTGNKRYLLLLFGCIGLVIHHLINVAFAVTRFNEGNEDKWIQYSWVLYINLLFQGFVNAFIGGVFVPGIAFVTKRSALSVAYGVQSSIGALASLVLTKLVAILVQMDKKQIETIYGPGRAPPKNKPNPVTKYTLIMAIIFAICSICCLLLTFVFVWFYKYNVCPKEIIPQLRDDGIKIVQDMEEKDDVTTIRRSKFSKKTNKKRLKLSPEKQMRRRQSSVHYITRFG